jgi:arsenate reductase
MSVVLFVCTGNAARSQMAEGWLKMLKPEFTVLSAGTKPEKVSKRAIKAMKEVDLDITTHTSKHLDLVDWKNANFAITLCGSANEKCVLMEWPEKCNKLHWPIKDPKSEEDFRNVRDEIKLRIDDFLAKI